MTLTRTFVAVSYGLATAAFVPVALSGEVGWAAPIAFVIALIASLLRDAHGAPSSGVVARPITVRIWTAALLLAFAGLIGWSIADGNWLLHALQFALLLTVSRFFQRRFAKDYLQLIALSFILLLVAAIVNPGPVFAACFLTFAVLTMWGLTLHHLVREIEVQTHTGPEHLLPPPPPKKRRWLGLRKALPVVPQPLWSGAPTHPSVLEWRTRRLIGWKFLGASAVVSLGVLAASALFFFLFPRLGMGFFFAQTRGNQSVIGFGSDAELGHFGAIKSSPEVVMRVQFPDTPDQPRPTVRLRGISFDHFEGNGWTRGETTSWELQQDLRGYIVPTTRAARKPEDRLWRADIYLEPLSQDAHVLFAPPQTDAVEILDARFDYLRGRKRKVAMTKNGDLTYRAPPDTALHYRVSVVESEDAAQEALRLRTLDRATPKRVLDRWTELPADLDPRIGQLARQLAGPAQGRFDQVVALERGLRKGWQYSLAGDQDPKQPLADFLFGHKRGHCEYFATAMALMARSLGHPAREVHGFVGGLWNPYGKYLAIRQGDAHAWVEVFFPGVGWRTFDPTPPTGQTAPPQEGIGPRVRQVFDSFSMLWYQWVVEYDLERQVEAMRSVGNLLGKLRSPGTQGAADPDPQSDKPKQKQGFGAQALPWLLAAAVLAALVALAFAWRRRRLALAAGFDPDVDRATARLQRQLTRRGLGRQPWETWVALAERVAALDGEAGLRLRRFAGAYDRARFAPASGPEARQTAASIARSTADWLAARKPQTGLAQSAGSRDDAA